MKSEVEIQEENILFSIKSVLPVLNLDQVYQLDKVFDVTTSGVTPEYGERELHIRCSQGNLTRLIEFLKATEILKTGDELIGYNTKNITTIDESLAVSIKKVDDSLRICYSKLGLKPDFSSQILLAGAEI